MHACSNHGTTNQKGVAIESDIRLVHLADIEVSKIALLKGHSIPLTHDELSQRRLETQVLVRRDPSARGFLAPGRA